MYVCIWTTVGLESRAIIHRTHAHAHAHFVLLRLAALFHFPLFTISNPSNKRIMHLHTTINKYLYT
jgi:hypothetical protein